MPDWHVAKVIDVGMLAWRELARESVSFILGTISTNGTIWTKPSIAWQNKNLPGYKVAADEVQHMLTIVSDS